MLVGRISSWWVSSLGRATGLGLQVPSEVGWARRGWVRDVPLPASERTWSAAATTRWGQSLRNLAERSGGHADLESAHRLVPEPHATSWGVEAADLAISKAIVDEAVSIRGLADGSVRGAR